MFSCAGPCSLGTAMAICRLHRWHVLMCWALVLRAAMAMCLLCMPAYMAVWAAGQWCGRRGALRRRARRPNQGPQVRMGPLLLTRAYVAACRLVSRAHAGPFPAGLLLQCMGVARPQHMGAISLEHCFVL